ncbi:heptaprenylglyceryl phosphate synthase, partial [Listeria monocytogenes]|nr:heptaprenylglyceryl phosphate synthase [Listeria monocytogenes]
MSHYRDLEEQMKHLFKLDPAKNLPT